MLRIVPHAVPRVGRSYERFPSPTAGESKSPLERQGERGKGGAGGGLGADAVHQRPAIAAGVKCEDPRPHAWSMCAGILT